MPAWTRGGDGPAGQQSCPLSQVPLLDLQAVWNDCSFLFPWGPRWPHQLESEAETPCGAKLQLPKWGQAESEINSSADAPFANRSDPEGRSGAVGAEIVSSGQIIFSRRVSTSSMPFSVAVPAANSHRYLFRRRAHCSNRSCLVDGAWD